MKSYGTARVFFSFYVDKIKQNSLKVSKLFVPLVHVCLKTLNYGSAVMVPVQLYPLPIH